MKTIIVFISVALATVSAVSVNYLNCPNVPADACDVTEVDVDPCKEHPKPCKLKKGADSSITFKFKPNFAASNLTIGVYWASGAAEPGFPDLDSNGCPYTTCPTAVGVEQTYDYKLRISKRLPQGTFTTKWKIWDVDNEANVCCFLVNISLKR